MKTLDIEYAKCITGGARGEVCETDESEYRMGLASDIFRYQDELTMEFDPEKFAKMVEHLNWFTDLGGREDDMPIE